MLFAKKTILTPRPGPTGDDGAPGGLRPIDPSLFRHVAGGAGYSTDAPKNGWRATVGTDSLDPPAPKNGW